ncbi:MAG: 2Fe-2S iron-sulfur cluster binding domain-containing protein [Rhizobiaceae bacterium]|nr:2Fe-2S iron-sulfur cluster binding domain-containing protein [Rhizobiaceae bacterium]
MAIPQFHALTIKTIRHPSKGSTALGFEIPDDLADTFIFDPGQYLTLRATIDGEDIRRSYSICSARKAADLEVGIKQVADGRFSNFATTLKVGDKVQVMSPQGRFTAPIGERHNYLLIAAGSGITPCLSIAKSVLEEEPQSTITLIYGNRSTKTVMFLDDINALKDCYTQRLQIFYAFSREQSDIAFLNGRLNGEMIKALCNKNLITLSGFDAGYICGPQTMTEELQSELQQLGMDREKVKIELFGTEQTARPATAALAAAAAANGAGDIEVEYILDGKRNSLHMDPQSHTVLAAAQGAGLDLPFSCAGGMCCTCRCKIVEGDATMDVNYSLQDWEIEAGFTLACQSRPTSKHLVLDFDVK